MSEEIYHLSVAGEQRGPYTRRQIDHQLNSGIIREDSLFVREGMADWAPVTNLVMLRRPRRRKFRGVLIAFICFLLVLLHFFGPVAFDGWRETAQFQYTEKAAYWRARQAIRHQALPAGALVRFEDITTARVVLDPPAARVHLSGELTEAGQTHTSVWNVGMVYDVETKQWAATSVQAEGK